jgi:hypothetical protein
MPLFANGRISNMVRVVSIGITRFLKADCTGKKKSCKHTTKNKQTKPI